MIRILLEWDKSRKLYQQKQVIKLTIYTKFLYYSLKRIGSCNRSRKSLNLFMLSHCKMIWRQRRNMLKRWRQTQGKSTFIGGSATFRECDLLMYNSEDICLQNIDVIFAHARKITGACGWQKLFRPGQIFTHRRISNAIFGKCRYSDFL